MILGAGEPSAMDRSLLGMLGAVDEGGRINYPDGFVSEDGQFLNFAFDDNRHRCVFYRAKLPPLKRSIDSAE